MARTSSSDVAVKMRRAIEEGAYRRFERLPASRQMAEEFGVARNTLRDAINTLEEEGLVEVRPGSGTYVKSEPAEETFSIIENTRPLELVEARFALEPTSCRLAVLRATERDLQRIEGVLQVLESCDGDIARFAEADEEFHALINELSGNAMIQWMMEQVTKARTHAQWARMRVLTLTADTMAQYNREHRAIYEAIRAREPEVAAQRMKDHLSAARESLVSVAGT